MNDELYLRAERAEYEARRARAMQERAVRTDRAGSVSSAGQRLLRILAELYTPGQTPEHDPGLFQRLAWSGADGD